MSNAYTAKLLLMLSLLYGCLQGQAQSNYQPNKVIPPSPTAASLGVYGDLSVGYYSGTPNISIPLYEVKTPNHSLAIQMSYNASGIRVSENASWVGLGWSLSAGGVITRTVRGLDDLNAPQAQGYYIAGALPPASSGNNHDFDPVTWPQSKNYFDQIKEGEIDGEPDIFSYNFDSNSGKLVMGKQANGSPIFIAERSNLKVEYKSLSQSWLITDGNGYKYYFATSESTLESYTYSSDANQISDTAPLSLFNYDAQAASVTTAWYLDSIVAPTTETLRFFYVRKGYSFSLVNKSEKAYDQYYLTGFCQNHTPYMQAIHRFYNATKAMNHDVYLDSIAYINGSIKFSTTDRADIEKFDSNAPNQGIPAKLSAITIRDAAGNRLKKYDFQYTYYNNDASISGRLKLDSITERGQTDLESKPPYSFSYFTPNNLPSKYNSKAIDHWGYYNGKNNTTILPAMTYTGLPNAPKYLAGGDRSADTTAANLKKGVLSTITYPTGGSTSFDYELHAYANLKGQDKYIDSSRAAYTYSVPPGYGNSQLMDTLQINDTVNVTFEYGFAKYVENANSMFGREVVYGEIRQLSPYSPSPVIENFSNLVHCDDSGNPSCVDSVASFSMVLLPGQYRITLTPEQGYYLYGRAYWNDRIEILQRKGGGLRVKSITNYENGQPAQVRKFYYTELGEEGGKSTGKLLAPLRYYYTFDWAESTWSCSFQAGYVVRMSGTVHPIGFTSKGTVVGYDQVTEVIGANGEGGKTVYYFYNQEEVLALPTYPSIPTYSNPLNGKMAVMAIMDSSGSLLKKVDYNYSIQESASLKGVKLYHEAAFPTPTSYGNYMIKFYDNSSDWSVLDSEQEKLYSPTGDILITKKYYYANSTHQQITRQEVTQSDGSTVITKYKYPGDYSAAADTSFVKQLSLQHILSPVIEQQTLVKRGSSKKLIAGTFTKYSLFHSKFYKPSVIYQLETSQPSLDTLESSISATSQVSFHSAYQPKVYFDAYENNTGGNLSLYHEPRKLHQSYLWDYNHALLVGEVRNALAKDVFYNSFEGSDGNSSSGDSRTGDKSRTTSYSKSLSNLTYGKYLLSYWKKESGKWVLKTNTVNVTTGSYSISLPSQIDDLRFYPLQAQMTTYTYAPQIGVTSATDVNNFTTFYIYDGLSRLSLVKDSKGNIVKKMSYHYKN